VEGQPRVNVKIREEERPSSMTVNGKDFPVTYKDKSVKLKW